MTISFYSRTSTVRQSRNWSKALVIGGASLLLAGSLVACNGSSGAASAVSSTQPVASITEGSGTGGSGSGSNPAGAGTAAGDGAAGVAGIRPAAFGTIAALSSGSMQVQTRTAQTMVNYTPSTT